MPLFNSLTFLVLSTIGSSWIISDQSQDGVKTEEDNLKYNLSVLGKTFANIQFTSSEHIRSIRDGEESEVMHIFEFAHTSDNKTKLMMDAVRGNNTVRIYDVREDGHLSYRLRYASSYDNLVSSMYVEKQQSNSTQYLGYMPHGLWPTLPFGKTWGYLVEHGAIVSPDKENSQCCILEYTENNRQLTAYIDKNTFVPSSLILNSPDGKMRLTVDKVDVVKGRWIAIEGKGEDEEIGGQRGGAKRSFSFSIKNVKINDFASDHLFERPDVENGVIVIDRTKHTTTVVGGDEARKQWEKDHPLPEDRLTTTPIRVNKQGNVSRGSVLFLVLSASLAIAATVLRLGQRRR